MRAYSHNLNTTERQCTHNICRLEECRETKKAFVLKVEYGNPKTLMKIVEPGLPIISNLFLKTLDMQPSYRHQTVYHLET